ncbi:hypothetical protein AB3N60_07060 [Leptospira sp. WS39.C2]
MSGIKMEEASFYGPWYYAHSTFYIEHGQLNEVLKDPNNFIMNHKEIFETVKFGKGKVWLLFEYCYDQSKPIQIDVDKELYQFEWNDQSPLSKTTYFYPYSYYKKGKRIRHKLPFYQTEPYPNDGWKRTTGYDQYFCVRNLLEFDESYQKMGKNKFKILTPREQLLYYEYQFDQKFIYYAEEEIN